MDNSKTAFRDIPNDRKKLAYFLSDFFLLFYLSTSFGLYIPKKDKKKTAEKKPYQLKFKVSKIE